MAAYVSGYVTNPGDHRSNTVTALVLRRGSFKTAEEHPALNRRRHSHLSYWHCRAGYSHFISSLGLRLDKTNVYNPRWPPHAKFHSAQTLLPGPLLALFSLCRCGRIVGGQSDRAASLYSVSQLGSLAFPGTSLIDPEVREHAGSGASMQPLMALPLVQL
jgi:hypothetical protein